MRNILIGCALLCSAPTMASDKNAQTLVDQARELYAQRATPGKPEQALQAVDSALSEVQDADLKYDAVILRSRIIYWMGTRSTNVDDRLQKFETAYNNAQEAINLNADYADGYYYYAVALARWGETKGAMKAYFRKDELMEKVKATLDRDTKDGRMGEEIDGYGSDRITGRVYYKLPAMVGGNMELSIKHLTKAYKNAPNYIINGQYLAESLLEEGEKAQACDILNKLAALNPAESDADRVPESTEEHIEVVKLKNEKCK